MAEQEKAKLRLEIAHVLFIDIVGYSKLSMDRQHREIERLNAVVQQTDEFRTADAARRLVKLPTGDGMALVFYDSPEAPAECAMEISRKLMDGDPLPLRIGIHSGPVSGIVDVNGRSNVAGEGINLAQRVMSCGDAGHILLSKRVADDLAQFKHWRPHLHDLGEVEVKHGVRVGLVNLFTSEIGNSDRPAKLDSASLVTTAPAFDVTKEPKPISWWWLGVGAVLIGLVAAILLFSRSRGISIGSRGSASASEKSIAVLPFENRSEDKTNAYFADGVQDEILTRLSQIADLKVISRTSTQHYKSAPENLPEIAKQLGVAHIVEGSVQKSGDAVRVNVQLIKAANDAHLWAETFDRKLTDIFAVESEVAKAIATKLQAKLTGREAQVIASRPTENQQAYDAYLRGLAYKLKPGVTPATMLEAQQNLREAVRLDPKFALAWALLAEVESRGYNTMALQPTPALREEVRQAVETALSLQPNLGEAVLAKGLYYYGCLKDYDSAVRYLEEAGRLLPNNSRVPEALAFVARRRYQWDESEKYFTEAEQLDPLNVSTLTQHAITGRVRRRFPEALQRLDKILAITPERVDTLGLKAGILQAQGDLVGAAKLLAPIRPSPDETVAFGTQIYQSILERRPAPVIARLEEVLAKPNPALGFINGEMRFLLGWAHRIAGNGSMAEITWRQTKAELEQLYNEQPENYRLIGLLALTNVVLGDKKTAFTLAERGMEVMPIQKDATSGCIPFDFLARVAAQAGDADRAIPVLQRVLTSSYEGPFASRMALTPALLRLDPMFDPIRKDPRFQQLAGAEAGKR